MTGGNGNVTKGTKEKKGNKCRVVAQLAVLLARCWDYAVVRPKINFLSAHIITPAAFIPSTLVTRHPLLVTAAKRHLYPLVVCFIQSISFVTFVRLPFAALTAAQPLLRVQPVARPVGSLRCSENSLVSQSISLCDSVCSSAAGG